MEPSTTSGSSGRAAACHTRVQGQSGELAAALRELHTPFAVVEEDGRERVLSLSGGAGTGVMWPRTNAQVRAFVPALRACDLGDAEFRHTFGLDHAYLGGAMANGIASAQMVIALGNAGMMAEYGAAGLDLATMEAGIEAIKKGLAPGRSWACNLIHSPQEPALERAAVALCLQRQVRCASASAFMDIGLELVRYRYAGIQRRSDGTVFSPNRLVAKVSRIEVARKFMSPPPAEALRVLVADGSLNVEQAQLAATLPMAQALTIEADSGGHTDNRPMLAQFPAMVALRERLIATHSYAEPIHLGAAGGIGTPQAIHAAFALGAAYVVTGSINQGCREAGTSEQVKALLASAEQADVAMAPAGDMFEMGVKVQVLKRGTMFAMRAQRLYDLYRAHRSLDEISSADRTFLEGQIFRCSLDDAWRNTAAYWQARDVATLQRAEADPKHRMALLFRAYLGQASRWAKDGFGARQADFQIWCGPAMGAFNEWTKDTPLATWQERRVVPVACALLRGAAVLARAAMLRLQGYSVPERELGLRPCADDLIAAKEANT